MSTRFDPPSDPYAVLGVARDATSAEITSAYREAVRALHPDNTHGDPDRLPDTERLRAVIAAYQRLRQRHPDDSADDPSETPAQQPGATTIPVRIRRSTSAPQQPDLRVGPVRRHREP